MNNNVLDAETAQFLQEFFGEIWGMFKAVTIPGTNMSALNVLVGLLFADVAITFIRKLLSNEAVGAMNIGYKLGGYVDLYRENHDVQKESELAQKVRIARKKARRFTREYERSHPGKIEKR